MKSQQQAEREEQQRIKNLVLNYDLRDGEDQDGDPTLKPIPRNMNVYGSDAGIEKLGSSHARPDKSGNNRSGQRARKLQLSDVDWYDRRSHNRFACSSALAPRFSQSQPTTERIMKPDRRHGASVPR
jgi:hypothetical protein